MAARACPEILNQDIGSFETAVDADEAFALWYAPKIKFFLGRTIERSHYKAFKTAPGAADFEDLQLVDEEGHFSMGASMMKLRSPVWPVCVSR